MWKRLPSPSHARIDILHGVAAFSARSAWAVGANGGVTGGGTVIVRWNGTAWKRVPSPSPGTEASLSGVAATSARTPGRSAPPHRQTLILRWNGSGWKLS